MSTTRTAETVLWILLLFHIITIHARLKSRFAPVRPPLIEENHNKERILFSFDPECATSRRIVRRHIRSLLSMFPCLTQTNRKIYDRNGDFHTYLALRYDNNNAQNLNQSCLDHSTILWDDFCLSFVDFELQFEMADHHGSVNCEAEPSVSTLNGQYLWHLDYIDGVVDGLYHCIDSSAEYRNVDLFVLDTSIQSSHSEFDGVTMFQLDPSFHEAVPLTLHGTHVAAIAVGKNVGITQGSPSIPLWSYPICRKGNGCAFSFIEDALERIISFIEDADDEHANRSGLQRVVINLSVQTKGLPSSQWVSYLENLFEQIEDLGGVIVASAGNKNIDSCQSFPGMSKHTLSVAAYGSDLQIYGNTGHCVDLYAPGIDIYSANLGHDDNYKTLKGTSMSAPMVSGLVANMLWANPDLTVQEIRTHLAASYHNWEVREDGRKQCDDNGCHLVHWDCDSYQVELLDYAIQFESNTSYTTTTTSTTHPIDILDIDVHDIGSGATEIPSMAPTAGPTEYPSIDPTEHTLNPTQQPTDRPSWSPVAQPSTAPLTSVYADGEGMSDGLSDGRNIECDLPDTAKPCECFDFSSCTSTRGCAWDVNQRHCDTVTSTKVPTQRPTQRPTLQIAVESTAHRIDETGRNMLCCNAMRNSDNGLCKAKEGQTDCSANAKCYWDSSKCLDEPCIVKRARCKRNDDCCSGVCIRFRGTSHCT